MRTIHIATGNPDESQDGSALWPYRVNSATQFDEIFLDNRWGTAFLLAPGEYRTRGCWAFAEHRYAMLGPNCSLIGPGGSAATFLRLDADYVMTGEDGEEATYVETVIGGGFGCEGSVQMVVKGLTIDASFAQVPSSGLHTYSGGTLIEDVRVLGVTGKWDGPEGFGILVNDSLNAKNGGNIIRACHVEIAEEDNYCNGIYLGSVSDAVGPNLIDSCSAWAETANPKRAHTAFACNENTMVRNCVGRGFERFCFSDTSSAGDIEITGCRGDFGYCAVDFPALPAANNAMAYRRRIRVSNCTFRNESPTSDHAIGILLHDQTPDHRTIAIEDIDMDGCRFSSTLPPGQFYVCSIQGMLTKRVWIRNSVFPEGSKTREGVYSPTPQSEVRINDVPHSGT